MTRRTLQLLALALCCASMLLAGCRHHPHGASREDATTDGAPNDAADGSADGNTDGDLGLPDLASDERPDGDGPGRDGPARDVTFDMTRDTAVVPSDTTVDTKVDTVVKSDTTNDAPVPPPPNLALRYPSNSSGSQSCYSGNEIAIGGGGVCLSFTSSERQSLTAWQVGCVSASSTYAVCISSFYAADIAIRPYYNTADAPCHSGEKLLGGAFDCAGSGNLLAAFPVLGLEKFRVKCSSGTPYAAIAFCSKSTAISAAVTTKVNNTIGRAECPTGTKVTGGGCASTSTEVITASYPFEETSPAKTGWQCQQAKGGPPATYAICVGQP